MNDLGEEQRMLRAIAGGDAQVFAQWLAANELAVRTSLRPFARHLDTEAVLQEGLLRVWQVAPRFRHDQAPNALLRFAITCARNVALSELRKARPSTEALDALEKELASTTAPNVRPPDPLLRQALTDCRAKLPEQPRRSFDARLGAEGVRDDDHLAQQLGMKLNTFLQNFTRARKLMAECLKKKGVNLEAELAP